MPETGNLADKPAPEIFRELAAASRSGVLRVSTDRKIRVVVFEEGRPVYAVSNVPEDQLDMILLRQRRITRDQAASVRRQVQKEPEIGPKLLELGYVDAETLDATKIEQITRVIHNAMLTRDGEFLFDPMSRVAHELSIEPNVAQWLLDTARNVTAAAARSLLGEDTLYVAVVREGLELSPLDSFLLGRVKKPMVIDAIRRAGEFSEEEGLPVIYALFASGLLARVDSEAANEAARERTLDEIRSELDGLLATFREGDFYDVLQVDRSADATDVKHAYYALAKQYHPDRTRHSSDPLIRAKLEAVFGHVSKAYDTLKDDKLRADYDRRVGPGRPAPRPIESAPTTAVAGSTAHPSPPQTAQASNATVSSSTRPVAEAVPTETRSADAGLTNEQLAERNFQEGLTAYQGRDVLRAIHLFRESLRLAPDKGAYHLHLGVALTSNPRWYKEAEKHLLEAARTDPMNLQIFLKLGEIYREGGLKKRAEAQFRQALTLDPRNRIARRALVEMGVEAPAALRGGSGTKDASSGSILSKLFKKK